MTEEKPKEAVEIEMAVKEGEPAKRDEEGDSAPQMAEPVHAKNDVKAYILAFTSSVCLGSGNYIMADVSRKLGNQVPLLQWPGFAGSFLLYHLYMLVKLKCQAGQSAYFSKETSQYYVKNEAGVYELSRSRLAIPVGRAVVQALIQFALTSCFYFTSKSGVNPGIISSIFAGGLIFVAVYFHFRKGQRLTLHDLIGTIFITVCVVLISVGSAFKSKDPTADADQNVAEAEPGKLEEDGGQTVYLLLAIAFAVLTALVFAGNTISIQYVIESGFNIDQANYDSYMLLSIVLFGIFMAQDKSQYELYDHLMANCNIVIIILGIFAFTRALASGNAGPVQAIQETKTIV